MCPLYRLFGTALGCWIKWTVGEIQQGSNWVRNSPALNSTVPSLFTWLYFRTAYSFLSQQSLEVDKTEKKTCWPTVTQWGSEPGSPKSYSDLQSILPHGLWIWLLQAPQLEQKSRFSMFSSLVFNTLQIQEISDYNEILYPHLSPLYVWLQPFNKESWAICHSIFKLCISLITWLFKENT